MDSIEIYASELYVSVVQPDTIWWDDLEPDIKEAWCRGARRLLKMITESGQCGCACPCHVDEDKPEWPGSCAGCCDPELSEHDCKCAAYMRGYLFALGRNSENAVAGLDVERLVEAMFAAYDAESLPFYDDHDTFWRPFAAKVLTAVAAPSPEAGLRRDPGVDWDAIERLVDAAIRREEITAARGAEILGFRLVTWRARAQEIRAAAKENDHE